MNLVGITINHKTAPIELREALHLSKDEILELIPVLKKESLSEGFILSTCNRTEIFGFPKDGKLNYQQIQNSLLDFKPIKNIKPENFDKFFSCSAVKHIFAVSAGIDSLIIGDSQILGQLKDAFEVSEDMNFTDPILKRIFDTTIKVGKRAIRETEIGEGAVSVSYAAVQVVEKIFANISMKNALVIGAGETGELAAVHLRDKGVTDITVTNRTLDRAEKLAEKIHGKVVHFNDFKNHLYEYDIIVSATSSDTFIINKDDIKAVMKKRRGSPICIMDIAIPRDVDPSVKNIDNVFYNDIDSLNFIVEENLRKRKDEIPKVNNIILDEMVGFFGWYNTLEVVPVIKSVRNFFDDIANDELTKLRNKVSNEDYIKVEEMTKRLLGRLLHNPTIKLRELAETGVNAQDTVNHTLIVKELFGLENPNDKNGSNKIEE
ncbi:MAG: glutamyl-tRNA reductase [Bacteroidetes bacterium]|nr:glutamyl-tRNA reductase [Bacteroidota bacterium]